MTERGCLGLETGQNILVLLEKSITTTAKLKCHNGRSQGNGQRDVELETGIGILIGTMVVAEVAVDLADLVRGTINIPVEEVEGVRIIYARVQRVAVSTGVVAMMIIVSVRSLLRGIRHHVTKIVRRQSLRPLQHLLAKTVRCLPPRIWTYLQVIAPPHQKSPILLQETRRTRTARFCWQMHCHV